MAPIVRWLDKMWPSIILCLGLGYILVGFLMTVSFILIKGLQFMGWW